MYLTSESVIGRKTGLLRKGQFRHSVTIDNFSTPMSQFNAQRLNMYHKRPMTKKEVMERQSNRMCRPGHTVAPVFLVLERDPLIAEDIIGALQEILPCRVLHAGDASEIASQLSGEDGISAAFLNMPFEKVVESGLDETLDAHGARIILTVGEDDQPQALARGWGMLVRPFTEDMIRDLVCPRPLR